MALLADVRRRVHASSIGSWGIEVRKVLISTLIELAEADPRVLLLTGDLGYLVVEPFAEKFPERFINAGVAEQNMVGIATGLAEAGYIPFVYSIGCFAALRPYEFIRNGPIAHQFPVRIIGVGGGFDYGHNGITHHNLEDLGVMRFQPGITVVAPADDALVRSALLATHALPGPVYFRLGKDSRQIVELGGRFTLDGVETIRNGKDLVILATGGITVQAVAAAEKLSQAGIEATVVVVASLSQIAARELSNVLKDFRLAATIEDHYVSGGLGSFVAEAIAESGLGCKLLRAGVTAVTDGHSGSQAYLAHRHGFSSEAFVTKILRELPIVGAPRS